MAEHHHAMTEAERAEHDELATTYATLLLHDAGVEITSHNLTNVLKAAGIHAAAFYPLLFAKVLGASDIDSIILNSGSAGAAAPAAAAAAPAGEAKGEEKKEEKKEEKEEEEEADLGLDLFG